MYGMADCSQPIRTRRLTLFLFLKIARFSSRCVRVAICIACEFVATSVYYSVFQVCFIVVFLVVVSLLFSSLSLLVSSLSFVLECVFCDSFSLIGWTFFSCFCFPSSL